MSRKAYSFREAQAMRPLLVVLTLASVSCGCAWSRLSTPPPEGERISGVPTEPGRAESRLTTRFATGENELGELVRTIDCDPYVLHFDYTPSVDKLIKMGDPAIPRMLDLMLLDGQYDSSTRLHAKTVLWNIILDKCGFSQDWRERDSNAVGARASALWKSLGDLQDDAPLADRERAVKLWREWLAKQKGDG
jgi:hypothetical protein